MVSLCVLWSKEIVIFTLGCTTVSSEIIPQMADEPLTPVLQFFSERKNFFTLDCPPESHESFLHFLVHCKMKIIPVPMILVNTLRLSRTKWESQA